MYINIYTRIDTCIRVGIYVYVYTSLFRYARVCVCVYATYACSLIQHFWWGDVCGAVASFGAQVFQNGRCLGPHLVLAITEEPKQASSPELTRKPKEGPIWRIVVLRGAPLHLHVTLEAMDSKHSGVDP